MVPPAKPAMARHAFSRAPSSTTGPDTPSTSTGFNVDSDDSDDDRMSTAELAAVDHHRRVSNTMSCNSAMGGSIM